MGIGFGDLYSKADFDSDFDPDTDDGATIF